MSNILSASSSTYKVTSHIIDHMNKHAYIIIHTKYETLRTLIKSFIIKSFKRPGVAVKETKIKIYSRFELQLDKNNNAIAVIQSV